jgi:hypothetical protein
MLLTSAPFHDGATRQPAVSLPAASRGADRAMAGASSAVSQPSSAIDVADNAARSRRDPQGSGHILRRRGRAPCVLAESPGAMCVIGDLALCGERNQWYFNVFDEKAMPCRRITLFCVGESCHTIGTQNLGIVCHFAVSSRFKHAGQLRWGHQQTIKTASRDCRC